MSGLIPWRPLSETFGAEADIDLSQPFTPQMLEAWRELFRTRHLILVRCGALETEAQERATRAFGELLVGRDAQDQPSTLTYVSTNEEKGGLGTTELAFHSDFSFTPKPLEGICLYGDSVVDGASSTKWISAIDGYNGLSPSLRKRIADLKVVNVISNIRLKRNRFNGCEPTLPATTHPIVRHTPSGEAFLYVNEAQTDHIVGLSAADSDAILDELFASLYASGRVVEHPWRKGDLVIWNNWVLQHARGEVSGVGERTLRRFQIGGVPLAEQFPDFMATMRATYGRGLVPVGYD